MNILLPTDTDVAFVSMERASTEATFLFFIERIKDIPQLYFPVLSEKGPYKNEQN